MTKFTNQILTCPWCDYTTLHSRGLSQHANKKHNKTKQETYLTLFPNAIMTCECSNKLKFLGLQKGFETQCGKCRRKASRKGKSSWNKGLTKENDSRMAKSAKNMKKHYKLHGHHNTGKTKENSELVRQKAKKISLTRKGVPLTEKHRQNLVGKKKLDAEIVKQRFLHYGFSLVGHYLHAQKPVDLICLKCQNKCQKTLHATMYGSQCPTCNPPWQYMPVSKWQQEIFDYVSTLTTDVVLNDRKVLDGKELDIYVPSHKFAIECNGIYWHSQAVGQYDKNHAEVKRKLACASNINLLTIFEDEWRDKKDILKSMIQHRLNKSKMTVPARKCTIQLVKPIQLRDFFNQNHIDGYVKSSYGLALMLENKIIAACTLRWAKNYSDKATIEIARLCFLKDHHIQGGLSKLITNAKKVALKQNATKLVTYTDGRFGGRGYLNAGIQFEKETVPRFWWTDFKQRYDRFKFRADKSKNLSELQIAKQAGVTKIYGCSNLLYSIQLDSNSS